MNDKPLKVQAASQGWKQFQTAKKEMLDAYDKAKTQAKSHKIETYHGEVAEAEFRKWLLNFLPKKYGVTSGYIVSQGLSDLERSPHFDVIIYEQLESPILWVENSPDSSEQGRSLAIPAEYVKGVIEVKSAFQNSTVSNSIEHLNELQPLTSNIDDANERYKVYLPADFFCHIAFFELRKQDEKDTAALNSMVNGFYLRGFSGAVILRGEGHTKDLTATIDILESEQDMPFLTNQKKESMLAGSPTSDSIKIREDLFLGSRLMWAETNFSSFAFDVIAKLKGNFEYGRLSSFYGFGTTELSEARKNEREKNL